MKYRKFGSLDWEASVLGFGAMRLPVLANNASRNDAAVSLLLETDPLCSIHPAFSF